jgi:hypothetical protein
VAAHDGRHRMMVRLAERGPRDEVAVHIELPTLPEDAEVTVVVRSDTERPAQPGREASRRPWSAVRCDGCQSQQGLYPDHHPCLALYLYTVRV